jgi:hypothetical protein
MTARWMRNRIGWAASNRPDDPEGRWDEALRQALRQRRAPAMGHRGDIATATKALASRGHCCQRRGRGRKRLARHVGALAPVCQ